MSTRGSIAMRRRLPPAAPGKDRLDAASPFRQLVLLAQVCEDGHEGEQGFAECLGTFEPRRDALLEPAGCSDPAFEVAPPLLRQPHVVRPRILRIRIALDKAAIDERLDVVPDRRRA